MFLILNFFNPSKQIYIFKAGVHFNNLLLSITLRIVCDARKAIFMEGKCLPEYTMKSVPSIIRYDGLIMILMIQTLRLSHMDKPLGWLSGLRHKAC